MKLFYGTGNQSKLRNMRAILAGMPIELVTPADLGIRLPAVEETGATPLENAALKAEAYHAVSGLPSFSLDSGLYLGGVPAELQPGPYVRRVMGRELSDEEFIAYYQQLAHQYGGRLKARFINGLCGAERPAAERSRRAAGLHRLVLDRGNAPSHPVKGLSHGQHCGGPPDRAVLGGGRPEGRTKRQGFHPCHRCPPVLFGTAAKRFAL